MTIYTVTKDGSGNFTSIQAAADVAKAGDIVQIKNGTYNEKIEIRNSGSVNNFITFTAYPGHTPTIDGIGIDLYRDGGLFTIWDKSYIRISNLKLIRSSYAALYANKSGGGSFAPSHIEFINNKIEDTWASAILILGGTASTPGEGCLVSGNTIYNAHNAFPTQNHEVISIVGSQNNFEIVNNFISHSFGGVIDTKDGVTNGKIRNNTFTDNSYSAIYIDAFNRKATNIHIYNNKIYNSMNIGTWSNGINIAAEQLTGILDGVYIYNNLIYNNPGTAIRVTRDSQGTVRNVIVTNNTIVKNGIGTGRGGVSLEYTPATNITIKNNIIYNNGFAVDNQIGATVENNLMTNPYFVNENNNDFHLQANSPAIDKGTYYNFLTFDFDNNSRPQGTGNDIGAFEYSSIPQLKWKCSGSPDYRCTQTTDGIYDTEIQCQDACKPCNKPICDYTLSVITLILGMIYVNKHST